MSGTITKLYRSYVQFVSKLQSPFLLIIRLYWGWQFFLAGKGKLLNLDRTAGFFANLNIPMPKLNVVLAGSTECFGGLLLLLGLGSRIVTVPLIFTMIVAYLTADFAKVQHIFDKPDDFVSAAPFQFMLTAIIVLIFGPGVFSLDAIIAKMRGEKKG
jgi:putative oxidoreductase